MAAGLLLAAFTVYFVMSFVPRKSSARRATVGAWDAERLMSAAVDVAAAQARRAERARGDGAARQRHEHRNGSC